MSGPARVPSPVQAPMAGRGPGRGPGRTPEEEPARWGTVANAVTLVRVATIPCLVLAILSHAPHAAVSLYTLAVVSDMVDGRLARRLGEASPLGGLLDHSADALFCAVSLGALAWQGIVPAPLPFLVAAAFTQYMLDSKSLAGQPLRASALGRWNGVAYFVLVGVPVIRDALGIGWPGAGLVRALGWTLVLSTLISMGDRLVALLRRGQD
jgi:phosphatidylglycerophosphate synthase